MENPVPKKNIELQVSARHRCCGEDSTLAAEAAAARSNVDGLPNPKRRVSE
jgi:hypothetical protein